MMKRDFQFFFLIFNIAGGMTMTTIMYYTQQVLKSEQARDTMSDGDFNAMMSVGLAQAKAGDSIPYEDAFKSTFNT